MNQVQDEAKRRRLIWAYFQSQCSAHCSSTRSNTNHLKVMLRTQKFPRQQTHQNDPPERHNNAKSTGCPEHTNPEEEEGSNHEEEEVTPTARTPTATFHRTVSYRLIGKHKGRIKQNATVSH